MRYLWAALLAIPIAYLASSLISPRLVSEVYGPKLITFQISPLVERNPKAKTSEIWVQKDGHQLSFDPKKWLDKGDRIVSTGDTSAPLLLHVNLTNDGPLRLIKSQWSGIANISDGHRSFNLDLYSLADTPVQISPQELYLLSKGQATAWTLSLFAACFVVAFLPLQLALKHPSILAALEDRAVTSKNISYASRLDHLRFIAASLVILYHSNTDAFGLGLETKNPAVALVQQGHTGVALFMVLSGYLLTSIGWGKHVNYLEFIKNRTLRIYPLYLLCVIFMLAGWKGDYTFEQGLGLAFPFITTFSNTKLPGFGHLWTIAIEFQFYLLFPFLLMFAQRQGIRYLAGVLGIFIFFKLVYWSWNGSVTNVAYLTLLGRMDQFLIGMMLAVLAKRHLEKGATISPLYLAGALALVAGVMRWFGAKGGLTGSLGNHWLMALWPAIEALMWGALILSYSHARINIPPWADTILARLGQLSFSMYCMHYLIIPFTNKVWLPTGMQPLSFGNVTLQTLLLTIPCVVLFSMLTYGLIEKPFLTLKKKYTGSEPKASIA